MELQSLSISSLNGLLDEITGRPQAKASTIALQQPYFWVGKTNTSALVYNKGNFS